MKKEGIIVAVIAMLLVAGCGSGGGAGTAPSTDYRSGSQGLAINFLPNYPPAQIYDDQPLDVIIEVRNRGAYEVGPATAFIYLSGFDPSIIPGIPATGVSVPQIEGKTQFNPQGGFDTVEFKATMRDLGSKGIDKYTAPLQATACYQYETVGSRNVCIDPDPYSVTDTNKVCTPSGVSFGSQGAPVAISSVEVDAAPRSTRFKINIDNVGGGIVFKPGSNLLQRCSPYSASALEYNEVNHVRIKKVEVSGTQITGTCKPEGNMLRLDPSGHGEIFCEYRTSGAGPAYTTPLTVELDYGYKTSITRTIDIIQTP